MTLLPRLRVALTGLTACGCNLGCDKLLDVAISSTAPLNAQGGSDLPLSLHFVEFVDGLPTDLGTVPLEWVTPDAADTGEITDTAGAEPGAESAGWYLPQGETSLDRFEAACLSWSTILLCVRPEPEGMWTDSDGWPMGAECVEMSGLVDVETTLWESWPVTLNTGVLVP
jgi:hypothetical protein